MTRLRTNCTVSIKRGGQTVAGLTALPCLVLPARPEIVAMNGLPAGKAVEFMFNQVYAEIREQDQLVRDDDPGVSIRITGVMHGDSPRAAHTEGVAEGRWGNA
jgi:hypothetical protein